MRASPQGHRWKPISEGEWERKKQLLSIWCPLTSLAYDQVLTKWQLHVVRTKATHPKHSASDVCYRAPVSGYPSQTSVT